jgi:hypothetical protein
MYRDEIPAELDFEAELYVVPSPRREAAVMRRVFWPVATWVAGWLICLYVQRRYVAARGFGPDDVTILTLVALPVLLLPLLPLHSLARRLLARKGHGSVAAHVDGAGLKITGPATFPERLDHYHPCLSVRVKSKLHLVVAAKGADAPFSLRVPEEATAQRVAAALGKSKMDAGVLCFPVRLVEESSSTWYGKMVSNKQTLKRASVVLLCGGYAVLHVLARLLNEWLPVILFGLFYPLLIICGVLFVPWSWSALLGEQAAGKLIVDALEVSLDGALLCSHTDPITLRILDEDGLEIRSARISGGKRLIMPWQPGDRDELELIKATIEACRARVSEESSG